ncbi:spermatogenesis-associated protein 25 [Anolis carolinensis]|uniref:spermatogenesis-associated protein 25 n=1 Tax=Anolis carolinensis TaxID=28377 RepID=UPI002F2B4D6B
MREGALKAGTAGLCSRPGQAADVTMSYYGMGKAPSGFFSLFHQGERSSSSGESTVAPRSQSSLCPERAREGPAPARISSVTGFLRRKLQAKWEAPLPPRATQLPLEPDPSPPRGGDPAGTSNGPWEPRHFLGLCARAPPQGLPPQECHLPPMEQAGDWWLCLPPGQQPKDRSASSGGDFAPARWGLLPRGVFVMPATLSKERGAPPVLRLPPNVCILTLAMMIAGIPTVPVPGVREEDMIQAAQCFMAEHREPEDGAQRRPWPALQRLGAPSKRERQRKRAAHRGLLPLFLAQLEK